MDLYDDPRFMVWRRRVLNELVPMIEGSAVSLSLVPEGETDIKFAVELGLSIMLGKPIIALVRPGVKVPLGLIKVADEIVEGDVSTPEGMALAGPAINAAVERIRATLDES